MKAGAHPEGAVAVAAAGAYNGVDLTRFDMLWLMQVSPGLGLGLGLGFGFGFGTVIHGADAGKTQRKSSEEVHGQPFLFTLTVAQITRHTHHPLTLTRALTRTRPDLQMATDAKFGRGKHRVTVGAAVTMTTVRCSACTCVGQLPGRGKIIIRQHQTQE